MERFGQIIVRTGIQSVNLVGYFTSCRQDEHAGLLIVLPQSTQHRHTVHLRQIQVEQHQIVFFYRQQLQRCFSVKADIRLIAGQTQFFCNVLTQIALILYHQKTHGPSSLPFRYLYYSRYG